jgi:hypothetical protein
MACILTVAWQKSGVGGNSDLYWLIYNSTIQIFKMCTPLLAFGYASLAIEHLIFAALSLEAQVKLNQAKYLAWRVMLPLSPQPRNLASS